MLQDIKFPETSGVYQYEEGNNSSLCKNRFIYWRIKNDIAEFVEESMDFNLSGNHVKFHFQDTPIIEGGISIHEIHGFVVILIATVASVHRLLFPHPQKFSSELPSMHTAVTFASVFCDVSVNMTREKNHFYTISNGNSFPHTCASWLSKDGVAYFSLANNSNSNILLVILGSMETLGKFITHELKQTSAMQRLWTGIVPSAIRGGKGNEEAAVNMFIYPLEDDIFTFALGRDAKLRMWSNRTLECVMCTDITPKKVDDSSLVTQVGAQKHMLKKAIGIDSNGSIILVIGVFLCFSDRKLFVLLKPTCDNSSYDVEIIATIYSPVDWDLIDFSVTINHLWAMWSRSDSQPVVKYLEYKINKQSVVGEWNEVSLVPNLNREPYLADGLEDVRQAYLKLIFHPGRFSSQTLNKAISIFRKTSDSSVVTSDVPEMILMQEVINAVENEIQQQTSDYELADDIYLDIQNESWSRFYSCCVEYHEVGIKPTGLAAFENSLIAFIIKKDHLSIVRPVDIIEYLSKTETKNISPELLSLTLSQDFDAYKSVVHIIECLHIINKNLSEDMKEAFKHDMYHLQSPPNVAQTIVDDIMCSAKKKLNTERIYYFSTDENPSLKFVYNQWMSSNLGVTAACNSIEQLVVTRFDVCRDLLLLQLILLQYSDNFQLTASTSNKIQSETLPKTSLFIHSYFVLLWASQTEIDSVSSSQRVSDLQQLTVLDLPEMYKHKPRHGQQMTVLELFVRGEGGNISRKLASLESDQQAQISMSSMFLAFLKNICCFMVSQFLTVLLLSECFMQTVLCPSIWLESSRKNHMGSKREYIRLLQTWCERNSFSRKFLLGYSFLNQGEHDKAVDCFLSAADGIMTNSFLFEKLLHAEEENQKELTTLYYLKVIRLLEQFNIADQILTVANKAVAQADENDSNLATLLSIIFKYHLVLGHYDEAYAAMNSNPDPSIKKDCLRQFVVVLCDRHQLKTLLGFPYESLYDDLVAIMESRARSVDLMQYNYYDIIYAFHILRQNYRKAGSIMYEYGMRLGREITGVKGLQKQVKCYLTAINALCLVNPKYAWIIKPVTVNVTSKEISNDNDTSLKGPEEFENEEKKRKIEVLELADVKREYKHVTAILHLVRKSQNPAITSGPSFSPSETVSFLVNEGLFDMAITLSSEYELPFNIIFEGLTSRCIKMMQKTDPGDKMCSDWDWLACNDADNIHKSAMTINATEQSWYLLKCYLEKYEIKGFSIYHRCIASKLLAQDYALPVWLCASYKKRNPAELLRLYLHYGHLSEAAQLSLDYIDAVMGKGKDHFNFENTLDATGPAVWLPYTALSQLLATLKQSSTDMVLSELFKELNEKLTSYQQMVSRVSKDMLQHYTTAYS
ncbi:Nuclear pore complex protein Nup160 [Nymphon striatum]|nr:Nuclear pore complex protein Nup160 [Nymphon striatum]